MKPFDGPFGLSGINLYRPVPPLRELDLNTTMFDSNMYKDRKVLRVYSGIYVLAMAYIPIDSAEEMQAEQFLLDLVRAKL